MAARAALSCAALIALAAPLAANAAAPAHPVAPPPKPPPGSNPYQPVAQTDVTSAYQFRTRILASPPSCERFAAQADSVFLSSTTADETKAQQLQKINADAAAAGCLAR
jgi:hypothetical protein